MLSEARLGAGTARSRSRSRSGGGDAGNMYAGDQVDLYYHAPFSRIASHYRSDAMDRPSRLVRPLRCCALVLEWLDGLSASLGLPFHSNKAAGDG